MNADVALPLEHPLHKMKIRAASSLDENLPIQYVYLGLRLSVNAIKSRLNALEKHHFRHRPEAGFENKRRILVGRDLTVTSISDMLKDLSDERVNEIAEDMNEVQRKCFTVYRRNLENGIRLIHGPWHRQDSDGSKACGKCCRTESQLPHCSQSEQRHRQRCSERILHRVLSHFSEWYRPHPRARWHKQDSDGGKTRGKYCRTESQMPTPISTPSRGIGGRVSTPPTALFRENALPCIVAFWRMGSDSSTDHVAQGRSFW